MLASALGELGRAPVEAGVTALLDFEATAGVPSTWFVMCGTPSLGTVLANEEVTVTGDWAVRRPKLAPGGCARSS